MILRYRVFLPGIKGFARIYEVNGDTTLYNFHKQMRSDMEFPQDQLILFKGQDEVGGVVARYGLFDLGAGAVDQVTVAETFKKGAVSFVYYYDVTNRKFVMISCEGEVKDAAPVPVGTPRLVETKGPVPEEFENGYVAYEDLPDDQRHLPGESGWDDDDDDKVDLTEGDADKDDDADSDDDSDDGDEDKEGHDDSEDGVEIYDGTEDLNL